MEIKMKKLVIKFISFFFVLLLVRSLNAQCADLIFPYGFGGGAPLTVVCTSNPGQTASSTGKPANKWSNFSIINWSIDVDNIFDNSGDCLDRDALKSCVKDAWNEWTNICPSAGITNINEDPGTLGAIPIGVDFNASDFRT